MVILLHPPPLDFFFFLRNSSMFVLCQCVNVQCCNSNWCTVCKLCYLCVRYWWYKRELRVCRGEIFKFCITLVICAAIFLWSPYFLLLVMLNPTLNLLPLPLVLAASSYYCVVAVYFVVVEVTLLRVVGVSFLFCVFTLCLWFVGHHIFWFLFFIFYFILVLMVNEGKGIGWLLQKWRIVIVCVTAHSFPSHFLMVEAVPLSFCNSPTTRMVSLFVATLWITALSSSSDGPTSKKYIIWMMLVYVNLRVLMEMGSNGAISGIRRT